MASPRSLLPAFQTAIQGFAASRSTLRIVRTIPESHHNPPSLQSPPEQLFVLDSSFNPPTRAHLQIASTALAVSSSSPKRLLLLLATQNADKPPSPASFAHRLVMMAIFANDLVRVLQADKPGPADIAVDVGITKEPYFISKAISIASSSLYESSPPIEQVHLIGFDTFVRILDPKYYPPSHTLAPLKDLFDNHRLQVTYRLGDKFGGMAEQDDYIRTLKDGTAAKEGWEGSWIEKITLVQGRGDGTNSTKARKAASQGDKDDLLRLCSEDITDWVLEQGLYEE